MRRKVHMKRRNVDVVIGDIMTDCFNGFDDAAASTLGIEPSNFLFLESVLNVIGAHLEYMRKKSSQRGARTMLKH